MTDTAYSRSLSQRSYLDDENEDGVFFSKTPHSDPRQVPVPAYNNGQIVTYQNTLSPATVATLTAAEKSLTVGTTAGNGVATTDFLLAVNKAASQAGLNCHMGRISAANMVQLVFSNVSGGTLTPSAGEVYSVSVIRGAITKSVALSPSSVPAASTSEQTFTIAPTNATITLTTDGKGRIVGAVVATNGGGAGYYDTPTIQVTDSNGCGKGAILRADVSGGAVVDVKILDPGENYSAPVATCVGGNIIAPGMFPFVNRTTADGVAVYNARIPAKNQIALCFANPTAAVLTPTASETYTILALSDVPSISNFVDYGVTPSLSSVASITSTEQSATVNGLLATDHVVGIEKPTLQAGLVPGGSRVSAANTLQIGLGNVTQGALTPTGSEIYKVTVLTQSPVAPFKIFRTLLTPAAIAANTSAEQTFTVTGLPFTNSSPGVVVCSKPSHQPGLVHGNHRITAANTVGITFENTTAVAITPTSEVWDIACFMAVGAGTGNWVALPFSQSLQRCVERTNELSDFAQTRSFEKGA